MIFLRVYTAARERAQERAEAPRRAQERMTWVIHHPDEKARQSA